MEVNGYQIRESIKRWTLQRDTVSSQFDSSLHTFEGEEKSSPDSIMEQFEEADRAVARLQEVQQRYNQTVMCSVRGDEHTLALCVKLVGGAGRREKMWRSAATESRRDRYYYRDEALKRSKDQEYATRTLTQQECVERAQATSKYASALRNAIARGNNESVETEQLGLTSAEAEALFN